MPTSIATIEAFLSHRRLALVGVSSNDKDLSRVVMRELVKRGYEVVPVGRHGGVVDGATVYANVRDIPRGAEPIGGVIIMVPSADSAAVVADCVAAGNPRVWLHRGVGAGATSREATALADQHGLLLVDGECPLMFVGDGLHAAHGALRRLGDHYPSGGTRRASPWTRAALVLLQVVTALGALSAGASFIADPSGAGLGMSTALLAPSPFDSFLVPGLVLFIVNGLGQATAAVLVLKRHALAARVSVVFGVMLCGWIAFQWLWLAALSWLQPACFAVGAVEIYLGFRLVRRAPRRTPGAAIDGPHISALLGPR